MTEQFQTISERHPASFSRGPASSTMLALLLLCSFLPATTAATAAVLSDDPVRLVQHGPHGAERDRREPRSARSLDRLDRRGLAAHRGAKQSITAIWTCERLTALEPAAAALGAHAHRGQTLVTAAGPTLLHLDLPPPALA